MNTTTTTRATAQRMYDAIYPTAARIVAAGQEHAMMMFVERDGRLGILPMFGIEPNMVREIHQRAARASGVTCALLVAEGWCFKARPGNADDERIAEAVMAGKVRTREVFNAEAITFTFLVGADLFMAMCLIDRATRTLEKGEIQRNGEDGHMFKGRMIESEQQANAN